MVITGLIPSWLLLKEITCHYSRWESFNHIWLLTWANNLGSCWKIQDCFSKTFYISLLAFLKHCLMMVNRQCSNILSKALFWQNGGALKLYSHHAYFSLYVAISQFGGATATVTNLHGASRPCCSGVTLSINLFFRETHLICTTWNYSPSIQYDVFIIRTTQRNLQGNVFQFED